MTQDRRIRSFVRRDSRITRGQQQALEKFWHLFGVDREAGTLDLEPIFKRQAPRILDIGTGMGDTTISLAKQNPDTDFLAVEVHKPGIGSLLRWIVNEQLSNIRILTQDINDACDELLPDRSFDKVFIFFPDPWPKKKHHKRRLISTDFLARLKPKLKTHGRLFLATDWQDYAEHMLEICDQDPDLINLAGSGNYAPRPRWRPQTKFEQRGRQRGHAVWDLLYGLRLASSTKA